MGAGGPRVLGRAGLGCLGKPWWVGKGWVGVGGPRVLGRAGLVLAWVGGNLNGEVGGRVGGYIDYIIIL